MIKKLKELEYRLLDAWNAECIANAQYRAKHADAPDFDEHNVKSGHSANCFCKRHAFKLKTPLKLSARLKTTTTN